VLFEALPKAVVEGSQRMLLTADEALSQIQLVENIDRFYEIKFG
jgi:hypothetical protein